MKKCLRKFTSEMANNLRLPEPLLFGFYLVGLVDSKNKMQEIKATFLGLNDKSHSLAKQYMDILEYPAYEGYDWKMSFNDCMITEKICDENDIFNEKVEANKRRAKERVQKQKSEERIRKFYIFCIAIPAWAVSTMLCWILWRLFL